MPETGNYIRDIKITGAGSEPVSLSQVKSQLIIDEEDTSNDTKLTQLITDCRKALENYTGISMVTHSVVLTADLLEEIELPHGPVNAITSVRFRTGTDSLGAAEYDTLTAADDYTVDGDDFKRFSSKRTGRHVIAYTTKVLEEMQDLKLALLNEVAFRFENKGDQPKQYATEQTGICEAARVLAHPYVRMTWV